MYSYALLYLMKIKYGYDVYVSENIHNHLEKMFKNLGTMKKEGNIWNPYILVSTFNQENYH